MADAPQIKTTGAGSKREAAGLGQAIGEGVTAAFAGHENSLHIDTLRLQIPASASKAEIDRAIRRAIELHVARGRR
jgi:hypothetical protein